MNQLWQGTATVDGRQNVPTRIRETDDNQLIVEAAYDGDSSFTQVTSPIASNTFNTAPNHELLQRLTESGLVTRAQSAGATGGSNTTGSTTSERGSPEYQGSGHGH